MQTFTLEVVADSIQGWGRVRRGSIQDADKQQTRHEPALVLRLLDLDPVMIEADSSTAMPRGFACFNGKGKALTFELPCGMLEQTLPLWLMALDLQPVDRESDARRAVLMSSSCINLAHEVSRALLQRSCAAPMVFQRLRLRMTSAHESLPDLQLSCFLRVYAGSHQPFAGGELLLEPVALPPGGEEEPEMDVPEVKRCTVETQTEAPEVPKDVKPPAVVLGASGSKAETTPPKVYKMEGEAFFADEIHWNHHGGDYLEEAPATPPVAEVQAATPSSLPLVSQLVRELMQMQTRSVDV
mmetsp:Transcript_38866/g.91300  ORF Transcript_38866/g.91300 Transcript_38866/m.91300 type:complete len:298 (+) Transcript_38866:33-926(+)